MTDERTPVRSYSTHFELDEDPISEGGMWLNGRRTGSTGSMSSAGTASATAP